MVQRYCLFYLRGSPFLYLLFLYEAILYYRRDLFFPAGDVLGGADPVAYAGPVCDPAVSGDRWLPVEL